MTVNKLWCWFADKSTSGLVLPELLSEEAYRISTAFCDVSDQPIPFPIPSRPTESLQFARITDDVQHTQLFKVEIDLGNCLPFTLKMFLDQFGSK